MAPAVQRMAELTWGAAETAWAAPVNGNFPNTEPGDGSAYPEYRRRSVDEGGHYGYKWYAGTRYEIDVSVCVLSTVLESCISKTH